MEAIIIEATKSSPFIYIDPATHLIQIKGESYPENAAKFFGPILVRCANPYSFGVRQRWPHHVDMPGV